MPKFARKVVPTHNPALLHKWSSLILSEGYVPFPKKLIRVLSQIFTGPNPLDEMKVVMTIVDFDRPDLVFGPSVEFLAFNAGLSVKRYREVLNELIRRGLISVKVLDSQDKMLAIEGLKSLIEAVTTENMDKKIELDNDLEDRAGKPEEPPF